ncbi:uncharacterized protein LOC118800002 [Colossoma macropomum]|uniref:uncharacterized protein LOC118800002 n=1 Tax=Colossoma macropomum TaxID=42526 RepID=UPI001863B5C4|nr:uncharacterized protein LOC118800002 [Colossoma macropomum]
MYLLVEFLDEGTTSPVAAEWYREGMSWWPPYTEKSKLLKSIRANEVPDVNRGWTQHQARILYRSDSLDKVVHKWRTSCETSDLNSDNESSRKPKPKRPFEMPDHSPKKKRPLISPQRENLPMKRKKVPSLPPPPPPPPPPPLPPVHQLNVSKKQNHGTNRSMPAMQPEIISGRPITQASTTMSQAESFHTDDIPGYWPDEPSEPRQQVMSKVQSYQGSIQAAWLDETTQHMMSHSQFLHQVPLSTFTEQRKVSLQSSTEDNQSAGLEKHHCDNQSAGQTNAPRIRLSTGRLVPGQCTPERAILDMLGELQVQVQHLTAVVTQRAPFWGNNSLGQTPLAPVDAGEDDGLPLESIQALKDMEIHLQNMSFRQRMVSKLSLAGGQTLKKTVWRICGKVFAPQLAVQLNWCGRGEKTAIKNTHLKDTIVLSAMRNPLLSTPTEAEAEKIIKEWLRLSGDRLQKRRR